MKKLILLLQSVLNFVGIDRKVGTGLLARGVGMFSGVAGSFLTAWRLSVNDQGLYYLFASLLALRVLFELGVGMSVIQVAAHARSDQKSGPTESPLEPAFVVIVNRWMARIATFYGVIAGVGGLAFIIYQGHGTPSTILAWAGFIVVGSLQFGSEGRWGLAEGAGFVTEANILRVRNNIVQTIALCSGLLVGAGLFSFCIAALISLISQEYYFRKRYSWMYARRSMQSPERLEHYRRELVTLIRRASQTYLTGYFVFQIQQPICFHLLGAASSAKLGFTQSIGNTLISLPTIWLAMNFPKLTHYIADGETNEGAQLFRTKWLQMASLTLVAALVSWSATRILSTVPKFHERILDPVTTGIFFLSMVIQTTSLGLTYWPRAFKIEPFVRIAYIQMLATPLFLWIAMSVFGQRGVAWGNLCSWTVGAIGIALIFKNYWQTPRSTPIQPA